MTMTWKGVMPAMTTCFDRSLAIDHEFMARHARWLVDGGCTGVVALGSLGEGATLSLEEKLSVLETCVRAVGDSVPVVAAISALSTAEATAIACGAAERGCRGLMVLPPYVYLGDWREIKAHVMAIMGSTNLSCMLYNNPVAYGTDFVVEHVAELAGECENFQAVKESSTDVRRVTAIRAAVGDRLQVFVGVDDAIVEGVGAGAVGWVAGLVNALPAESVALFDYAARGESEKAFELYKWFLPLLRLDTVPKFVQLIKLVQREVGVGTTFVRPPRLELDGDELRQTVRMIRAALDARPTISAAAQV